MAEKYAEGHGKGPYLSFSFSNWKHNWKAVVLYVVISGIIYAGIYYFVLAKKGGYKSSSGTNNGMYQY